MRSCSRIFMALLHKLSPLDPESPCAKFQLIQKAHAWRWFFFYICIGLKRQASSKKNWFHAWNKNFSQVLKEQCFYQSPLLSLKIYLLPDLDKNIYPLTVNHTWVYFHLIILLRVHRRHGSYAHLVLAWQSVISLINILLL